MFVKSDKLHLKKLLSDAIPLLCKNSLLPHSKFRVEAMIAITVDDNEVALICINEMVAQDGEVTPQTYGVDEDLVEGEEFGRKESGCKSVGNAEGSHDGFESYGEAINNGEFYVEQAINDNLDHDTRQYEDVEDGVDFHEGLIGGYGYERNTGMIPRSKSRRKPFAAGSDQFIKQEFDHDADASVEVKEEFGLDAATFSNSFGFERTSGGIPAKLPSSDRRVYKPRAGFVASGESSLQSFPAWPSKMKKVGPLSSRKVPGKRMTNGKASGNVMPTGQAELHSQADQRQFLNNLCQKMVQDSIVQTQYYCHICHTKLSSKSSLATHIKGSHIDAKLYACNQCDQSFKWYMQLYRHKKYYHSVGQQNDSEFAL